MLDRLQSVLNAAARLIYRRRSTTVLLQDLHWLSAPERIKFRLAVLVFRCRINTPGKWPALGGWQQLPTQCLSSSTTHKLIVPRTRLRTFGDRTLGAAAARVWKTCHLPSPPRLLTPSRDILRNISFSLQKTSISSYSRWRSVFNRLTVLTLRVLEAAAYGMLNLTFLTN